MQKKYRIQAALYAYAYEIMNKSIVSDAVYDMICNKINPEIKTGNDVMDVFFAEEFSPYTGMWIYKHPDINGIIRIYESLAGEKGKPIDRLPAYDNKLPALQNMPYATHFENMVYLASLGFHVVGGRYIGKDMIFDYEFDKDFITLTNPETKEQKQVLYSQLLG